MAEQQLTHEQLMARIAELEAKVASRNGGGTISFKVSEKGAVSVYGLGRMPVTLYSSQWDRFLPEVPRLVEFLKENRAKLATKPAKNVIALDATVKVA